MATYFLTWPPKPSAPRPLRRSVFERPGCTKEEANEAILRACEEFNIPRSDAIRHWRLRIPSTGPKSSDSGGRGQETRTSKSGDSTDVPRSDSPGSSEPGTATARTTKLRVIVSYDLPHYSKVAASERRVPNETQQLQPDSNGRELPTQPQPLSLEGQLEYRQSQQQPEQQCQQQHCEQTQRQPLTQHQPDSEPQRQRRLSCTSSERDSRPSAVSDPRVHPHPHHWPRRSES
ncbi:hypothetical protein C8Q80DRAFT_1175269 [Daedaleopsis nitida]|nr:hypothetical protein C8Q80DRAFT_1175269 [Daedaleopsis nitida]